MTHFKQLIFFLLLVSGILLIAGRNKTYAQYSLDELRITHVTIIVKDLKISTAWYRKFLKFKIEEYRPEKHVKIQNGDFKITLKKGQNTLLKSQIRLKNGKKYINGISKIGFSTNKFDSLHLYLERYEQPFITALYKNTNLNVRTFTVADPDGNHILFLDSEENTTQEYKLTPRYFTIRSSDYINTLKWYTDQVGFVEIKIIDDTNIHYQNFLKLDQIVLELIHLPYESIETTEFMPIDRDLAEIEKITIQTGLAKDKVFELDNNGNKVLFLR